jgi:hypothetical protein
MCGYCTKGIAFDIAQAEAEDRRYVWLDEGHDLVMEMVVQERWFGFRLQRFGPDKQLLCRLRGTSCWRRCQAAIAGGRCSR